MTGASDHRGPDLELIGTTAHDQDFIAVARQDLPRLVEAVRTLQAYIRSLLPPDRGS